jgi:RNA 2',3'-cyclic 3'-phosphodiesterase
MRLFVAIDLDDSIRERIARFLEGVRGFAPDARWVRPESLHVTLKFIGEGKEEEVEKIKAALGVVRAAALALNFHGCGYFPSARAARVFWVGVESDEKLASAAEMVDKSLAPLGISTEEHEFNAHLTLARSGTGKSAARNDKRKGAASKFQHLQERLARLPAPEFGSMTVREFFLYQSKLSPGGSLYTKLARFELQ